MGATDALSLSPPLPTPMPEYPGQELSIEQLFRAVRAKVLERTQLSPSLVPNTDQERWVSVLVADRNKTLVD